MTGNLEPVSQALHHDISQHYYREVRMFQDRQHREWLAELVAPDIHYWMPVYEQRFVRDRRPPPTPNDAAIYNDDYDELKQRVERLYTGQVWMEDPPSNIRYLITNVEAYHTDKPEEFQCYANICVHRHRRQREGTTHFLGREDLLRRTDNGFQVARRKINLDVRVVQDKNLYFFV